MIRPFKLVWIHFEFTFSEINDRNVSCNREDTKAALCNLLWSRMIVEDAVEGQPFLEYKKKEKDKSDRWRMVANECEWRIKKNEIGQKWLNS